MQYFMYLKIKLAFRNVFRNRTRSLITISAIAFGCMSIIFAGGFMDYTIMYTREEYIRNILGHIQIARKGYFEKGIALPFDMTIPEPDGVIRKVASVEHVKHVAPRVEFGGIISTGENAVPFIGLGGDPDVEKAINSIKKITSGENLEAGDTYKAIMGGGLAQSIMAKVGNNLVMVASTKGGIINAFDISLKGIFRTGDKAYDDRVVRMPIETVRQLLSASEHTHALVILLDDTQNTDKVMERLVKLIRENSLDLEAKPWHDLAEADYIHKAVAFLGRILLVLKLMIIIIVVLSIFNTMNMSVTERTGEIGTIMALGNTRKEVLSLFLTEGFILGIIGGGMGLVGGYIIASFVSWIGIPMPAAPGASLDWVARINIVPKVFLHTYALAIVSALASSYYPALKASKIEIAQALRYNI